MRQWEIYDFPHPSSQQPHPCVVISPTALADDSKFPAVNLLPCKSFRPADKLRLTEVRLDQKDGLDGPTVVQCQFVISFLKTQAGRRRGEVTPTRRRAIQMKFKELFGFHAA